MEQECGVRVMCRFRPLNESEVKRGKKSIIQFKGDDTVVVSGKPYVFDKVLSPSMTQEQVYEFCAKHTVIDVLGGYNGTLFTYGQTSSGKTHTMEGRLHDPQMMGIIPRVAYDIFNHIYSMQENIEFHIKDPHPDTYFYCEIQTFMHSSLLQVSYFEIYLEKIRDLLDVSKTNLPVHENKNRVPFVKGCSERFVSNPEEMMGVIDEGKANRRVAVTNMNEHSSRSHSIFLINIKQEHLDTAHKLTGKLYLVDLAGSEKVSKTGATGAVLDEAKMINKSLSALGNVISALAEGTKSYVPYRDSKMTRILQDSLGGNCRTTIIICCSPSTFNEAETRSTLFFGQRAKSIRNTVCVNLELTAEEWKQKYEKEKQKGVAMKQLVDKLQTELNHWKTGVCVPVMEQLFDGQQEELSSCAPVVSNGLASETLGLENGPCEENITKLYKLMDDKDEEIHLQTQLMEKLTLHLEVQEEFLASSQRDCAQVQEELCSLLRNNEEMKGEVWEVLSALEELALNYDRKSQNASNSAHMNGTLSEQLAMKNEMIAATQSELTELQELDTVEKGRVVDILHVLLKDLCDVASAFSVCEIKMVCEDGISLDDEFSAVHLFLTKLKSELKSFINRIKRLESTHEHTSFNILANERELASCRFLVSQYEVKIRSLTECIPKAEETEKELELTQRTLTEELTELRTYESNQDLCQLETQEELLKRNPSQQNPDALMEGHRDDPSKTLIELREEFNNRQRVLDEVQEINENLILEQKRLQCENETLRIQEQEKEIKLQKLTESNESTERHSNDLREFEETLVWQLQCLHNLRKMFVQDLATHMKESSAPGCEDGGNRVIHKRKISFLENNLEQLTKVHKQLVQQNADLRCALPKLQKRLCAMMERVESLECALREAKQSASRERRLYQQELDRIRDIVRAKCMASYRHAPLIVKPIRAGHHHTFSVMAGGGSTIYSHHHV